MKLSRRNRDPAVLRKRIAKLEKKAGRMALSLQESEVLQALKKVEASESGKDDRK